MATIMVHPTAEGIRAGASEKWIWLDLPDAGGITSIFVQSMPVLDALQAALDEIRVHLTASETPAAELPIADMAPGELELVFGR